MIEHQCRSCKRTVSLPEGVTPKGIGVICKCGGKEFTEVMREIRSNSLRGDMRILES